MYAAAKALVSIRVQAVSKCYAFGDHAFGCAKATSYANSQSTAIVKLVGLALAGAANGCLKSCDPASTDAFATTFAALVVSLDAKAAALVRTRVCVGPNQAAYNDAYAECVVDVYARGLTWAFARAVLQGGCTAMSGKIAATAYTEVENLIDFKVKYCNCEGYSIVCTRNAGCTYVRQQPDPTVLFSAFAAWPLTQAKITAHCAPSAKQLL